MNFSALLRSNNQVFVILVISFLMSGCGAIRNAPKYQLADDYYLYRQKGTRYQNTFVHVENDTIKIVSMKEPEEIIVAAPNSDQFFLKSSFDIDVMTVGFKYRPGTTNLPRQVNTDFNGNAFVGFRMDRFRVRYTYTPIGITKGYHHRAITGGLFFGIGSSAVTPWTTNNLTTDEYNALILSRGLAVMFGVNNLTVGFGVGWDYLTDRDKNIWIYQNHPWYGLTVGLNLN